MNQFGCLWEINVHCLDPVCVRQTDPVWALDAEQALLMATDKVSKKYGKQGENWSKIEVYIKNIT